MSYGLEEQMTQSQVYEIFKKSPYFEFKAEDLRQELLSEGQELNIQSCYNNIRRLEKANYIIKTKRGWYYADKKVDKIIQESQHLYTGKPKKHIGNKNVMQILRKVKRILFR